MANYQFHNPVHIHFGAGSLALLGPLAAAYGSRCLLVTTSNDEAPLRPLYDRVKMILFNSGLTVAHFDEVVPNPTIQSVEKAIALARRVGAQVVVAVGGGSSIDAAKAVALFHQKDGVDWHDAFSRFDSPFAAYPPVSAPALPIIAVPTTAGTGSEMTQAMILSDPATDEKACIFHSDAFPAHAVIDSELTLSMPARLTAITGFDAFCHAFESRMRAEASPYTLALAQLAIEDITDALPRLLSDPHSIELREKMSQAAMFAGISLSNAAATVPHPLSEIIGGIAPRIAHGQALACLYPAYIRFQVRKTPEKCAQVARLMDASLKQENNQTAVERLPELVSGFIGRIGLDKTLTQLGVTDGEKEKMLSHFLLGVLPFGTKEELTAILQEAF